MCARTCFSQAKCSRTCISRSKCYGRQFSSKKKESPQKCAGPDSQQDYYVLLVLLITYISASYAALCVCVYCVCSSSCCCCCCCVLHAACVLADKICYSVEQHHLLSAPTTLSQNRSGEGETLNEAQRITNPYTSLRFQRSPANICVFVCVCVECERERARATTAKPYYQPLFSPFFVFFI